MNAPLPIDEHLPAIVRASEAHRGAVVVAEPGAGKTTRVPRALLEAGASGRVLVLEPRRIAARLSAERVAAELGGSVGADVGYVTRFERAVSDRTRLTFVTEGILSRRLLSDPTLDGIGTVVLDEFHERHLASDVGLALLRRLRDTRRPDLRIVAMSATLDPEPIARFLDVPALRSEGKVFPITIDHAPKPDDRALDSQVASALFDLLAKGLEGHVLVFLPGAREIRACLETCRRLADKHDLELLPLHGSLSVAEQNRAILPSVRRKVIFATNVAETSITIDGIRAVIDSGLANVASCSPWTGLPVLKLAKVSKASAVQRAGRAGRTAPGVALRLYTQGDFAARPAFEAAEIARVDLCEPVLELLAQGVADVRSFGWFEPPPEAALTSAVDLLGKLGALQTTAAGHELTATGRRMLTFPTHPRLARVLVEAERRGVAFDACTMAALISERTPPISTAASHRTAERSDLFPLMDELERGRDRSFAAASALRVRDQLRRVVDRTGPRPDAGPAYDDALLLSLLSGYPDRVGRIKKLDARSDRSGRELVFAAGGSAMMAESSAVREAELAIAIDVEDRVEGARQRTMVRLASEVRPDWLLDVFTDAIVDEEIVSIAQGSIGRVEAVRVMRFGNIVLEEKRSPVTDDDQAARVLAQAVASRGLPLETKEALERLAVRISLAKGRSPSFGDIPFDPNDEVDVIRRACAGRRSLTEVLETDFAGEIERALTPEQQRLLRTLTPERVELPSGRSAVVKYAPGVAPSVASRLQDFFGMAQGPSILGGAQPILLELLAPNGRAVQVTTDLAGFWERHYPTIAKELRRKYPRHAWPEDPRHATPPPPKGRR